MQSTLKHSVNLNKVKQFKTVPTYQCSECKGEGTDKKGDPCYFCLI
jgi:hypothetical protein